jgi:hypothetical protein
MTRRCCARSPCPFPDGRVPEGPLEAVEVLARDASASNCGPSMPIRARQAVRHLFSWFSCVTEESLNFSITRSLCYAQT